MSKASLMLIILILVIRQKHNHHVIKINNIIDLKQFLDIFCFLIFIEIICDNLKIFSLNQFQSNEYNCS
jgi:hypothetical protein